MIRARYYVHLDESGSFWVAREIVGDDPVVDAERREAMGAMVKGPFTTEAETWKVRIERLGN